MKRILSVAVSLSVFLTTACSGNVAGTMLSTRDAGSSTSVEQNSKSIAINKKIVVDLKNLKAYGEDSIRLQSTSGIVSTLTINSISVDDSGNHVTSVNIEANGQEINIPVPDEFQSKITVDETLASFSDDNIDKALSEIKSKIEESGYSIDSLPDGYSTQGAEIAAITFPVYIYMLNLLNWSGMWWWSNSVYWAWVVLLSGAYAYAWAVPDNNEGARRVAWYLLYLSAFLEFIGVNKSNTTATWNNSEYVKRHPEWRIN